jgi:anti-anti-sigma factor
MDSNPYFAMSIRITEPTDEMTVEIEGDLDAATIPFLAGMMTAAEQLDARDIVIDVRRLSFVGLLGVRALTDEAERLELRGRRTRLVGASATLQRMISLTGGFAWLDGRRHERIDQEHTDHEATRVPSVLAHTIHSIVPGARCVSITSTGGRGLETLASTDLLAEQLDRVQYQHESGPCVEAVRDQVQTVSHDLAHDPRWPAFAAAAARRRILSVLSTPVPVRAGQMTGLDGPPKAVAVNIYSERSAQFDDERCRLVAAVATQVTQLAASSSVGGVAS